HNLRDVVGRVQADKIKQGKGPHGIATAELHGVIDILHRAYALLVSADSVEQIGHQQPINDKSGFVAGAYGNFAELLGELVRGIVNVVSSGDCAHHLDQFHQRNRIKKVQPDKTFRTLRGSQEFSNGNRRGIRGEDRIFLHHAVQRGVDLFLLVDVLNYGLNDDVAISQILLAGRALKAAADHLRTFLERALLGKLGQRFLNPRKSSIEIFLLNFEHSDIETSRGRNLRDARTHEATAQHANFLDFHKTGE